MITPRRTRLVRAPDLQRFRQCIAALCRQAPHSPVVLVPTSAARRQLLRTLGTAGATGPSRERGQPLVLTRDDFYDLLHRRLPGARRRLSPLERHALAQAAAAAAARASDSGEGGRTVPFSLRPGLVVEMFRFYDQLRRQSRRLDRFQTLIEEALGGGESGERGTDRALAQTRLLVAVFQEYEQRVQASDGCDEHGLRDRLMQEPLDSPPTDIIVTVADWIAEPDGLFISDFDLLARMPKVERIDLVCTEQLLGSGFHERVHDWWPGLEEVDASTMLDGCASPARPVLEIPVDQPDRLWFTVRDRQEELTMVAQRVKARRRREEPPIALERTAVVFKRPLPYLYLADATLWAAGIPFQAFDALPLATSPVVATLDLVLDALETRFAREALLALLRAPQLAGPGGAPSPAAIQTVDAELRSAGYLGELERLIQIVESWRESQAGAKAAARGEWRSRDGRRSEAKKHHVRGDVTPDQLEDTRRAFDEVLAWARELAPLLEPAPASEQIDRVRDALARRLEAGTSRPVAGLDGAGADTTPDAAACRARDRMLQLLAGLAAAHRAHHDPSWTAAETATAVRTCIEAETLDEPSRGAGVQLLDDRAARYGGFDDVTIVGLTDTDWPERQPRNVFYPSGLLRSLGWPSEHTRRRAADARFVDLLASSTTCVAVTTIALDDEAIVMPSVTLDEIRRARLSTIALPPEAARITASDALTSGGVALAALTDEARDWARLRLERSPATDPAYHGFVCAMAERAWSVSALEVYLACPFKFFAQHVLRLEEEALDSDVMDPREQGQFVHGVFEAFFAAWSRAGQGTITPDLLGRAREVFAEVVEAALVKLPEAEAGLERTRLLGSSAAAGLGEAVMRMEAERPVAVVERLLEHRFSDEVPVTVPTESGPRPFRVRGKADRIDLLEDGTFRLIDYKLGWPPQKSRALQLPVYALTAEQQLSGRHGRTWTLGEAAYLAFKGPKRIVPLIGQGATRDRVFEESGQRLAEVVNGIERGEFPPAPDDVFQCERCGYAAVCRKDYVGDVRA